MLDRREIMLAYSDSGKEAGRLAAAWELYKAQEKLVAVSFLNGTPKYLNTVAPKSC